MSLAVVVPANFWSCSALVSHLQTLGLSIPNTNCIPCLELENARLTVR